MRYSLVFLLSFLLTLPVSAQSLMEFGDLRAGAAGTGAGAGLSASMGHKGAVKRSFEKLTKNMTPAQRVAYTAQTNAINKYWASGCQYEMAKQWSNAEKTFAYVLQVITMRDGTKSPSRLPVLQKLVRATKAQKKLETAIGYQKSIVDLHKFVQRPDERMVAKTQEDLTGLYLEKHDYKSAEPVLKDSVLLYAKYPSLPSQQKIITLKTYSTVLRKLKKNAEADKIDKQLNPEPAKDKTAIDIPASKTTDVGQTDGVKTTTSEPATTVPVTTEPVTTEPVTTEPITSQTKASPVESLQLPPADSVPADSTSTGNAAVESSPAPSSGEASANSDEKKTEPIPMPSQESSPANDEANQLPAAK